MFQSDRYVPRGGSLEVTGPGGLLRREDGTREFLWTSFSNGKTTPVSDLLSGGGYPGALGAGSDTVAIHQGNTVALRNLASGTTRTLTFPATDTYLGTYGETVLTYSESGSGSSIGGLNLHRLAADGSATSQAVAVDAGSVLYRQPLAADAATVVLRFRDTSVEPDQERLGLLDIATGQFVAGPEIPVGVETTVALGEDRMAWHSTGQPIRFVSRTAPAAAPGSVALPTAQGKVSLGITGDWVVVARKVAGQPADLTDSSGMPLMAVKLTGGSPVTLLRHADEELLQVPGGDLLATGGADSAHWAVRRLTAPADGTAPTPAVVADVEPVAAKVERLSLANGTLATKEADGSFLNAFFTRSVATDGARLTPEANKWADWAVSSAGGPWSAGDGRVVSMSTAFGETALQSLDNDDAAGFFRTPSTNGKVLDITGRYAVVNGSDPAKQYVGDLGVHRDLEPILTRGTTTAASVWGSTFWTQTTSAGWLQAQDLKGGFPSQLNTGAPCVAKELQAVGRWIYWSCGTTGPAGVWDRTAKKNIPVPAGEALIGDGYLVRHDKAAGKLLLTGFRDGVADTSQPVGDLPATTAAQRGVTWTVDKFGGPVAYVAGDGKIHLAPSGVTSEPLKVIEHAIEASLPGKKGWQGRFHLSRPASTWQLQFKRSGKVVRTFSGTGQSGVVTAAWDGRTDDGRYTPNGAYTWLLVAQPADGQGPAWTQSGSLTVDFGAPQPRDHGGPGWAADGKPDLWSLGSKGDLSLHYGNGTGAFSGGTMATEWPTTAVVVPFGDLDGDRCNDLLVRMPSNGELRAYRTYCDSPPSPSNTYTSLGTAWAQFNVLTSPGDLTGDGRADLVARQASTGDMYLYADDGAGKLKARGRIGTNWKSYRAVFGAGDLNGDGIGDLLAVDGANQLWRYDGTAAGMVKPRVLVFGNNWGTGRNVFVGVGDITGDGKADLVSRNAAGDLLRNSGNGAGAFGSTVKIGAGWQARKGLF
ncbi:FG-GAP-like repeat-containing protein [Streptomyces sp. NPDC029004]|uniref:FG-GAP-like repeat-containing protein n=1 Tax=Streptomyces sp. NPDC029004 TaxID=3154490 RepID=UPI00340FA03D